MRFIRQENDRAEAFFCLAGLVDLRPDRSRTLCRSGHVGIRLLAGFTLSMAVLLLLARLILLSRENFVNNASD